MSCVQVWAPGTADNGDCRWSWLWVPCSAMQPQPPAWGDRSQQRTLPTPAEPRPPHSHLRSHFWTPWPRWLRRQESAGSTVSAAGMQAFKLHFKDIQSLVCAPRAPQRETDSAKPAWCLHLSKLSWVCTWTHVGLCVGTHECAWMRFWAGTTRQHS